MTLLYIHPPKKLHDGRLYLLFEQFRVPNAAIDPDKCHPITLLAQVIW